MLIGLMCRKNDFHHGAATDEIERCTPCLQGKDFRIDSEEA
jgi:hypothetical protein